MARAERPTTPETMSLAETEVVSALVAWTASRIRSWYPNTLRAQLARSASEELQRIDDRQWAEEYRAAVGLPIPVDDLLWANRVLALSQGGWALTGIRFRGRDLHKPFVDIIATSVGPSDPKLISVAEGVAAAYRAFEPRCVRLFAPSPDELVSALRNDDQIGPATAVDQYVMAGMLADLRDVPVVRTFPRVRLVPGSADALAASAAAIYAERIRTNPEAAPWASAEDADSLSEAAEEGLLFEIRVDDAAVGVVAAARQDGHGLSGFVVQELCLDAPHRGHGLGPAVLQHLVRRLPSERDDTLWGTIHPDNAASLHNASRVGREQVGGYVWITPVGLPGMPGAF